MAAKALSTRHKGRFTNYVNKKRWVGSPKKQDLVNGVCERHLTEEDLKLLWFRTTIQVVIHPFTTATLYFRGVALEECTIMFFSILIPILNLVNPKDISKYDDKDGAHFLF